MNGIITDVQRFCVHDGPGIRTTVFLKGCNMRCGWCHNPETIYPTPELQVLPEKCIACGACLTACPRKAHTMIPGGKQYNRTLCTACGSCARTCYAEALQVVGRQVSAEQVAAEVLEDREFYAASGGGMTLSGGEPLYQRAFTIDVLQLCRQAGVHTAIETNLARPWEQVESVLPYIDLAMVDLKMMDPQRHMEWTGVPNRQILENAQRLAGQNLPLIVRTPIIPGVNDSPEEVRGIADFIAGFANLLYYELLPYHPLGEGKYASLGRECRLSDRCQWDRGKVKVLADVVRQRGIKVRPSEEGDA